MFGRSIAFATLGLVLSTTPVLGAYGGYASSCRVPSIANDGGYYLATSCANEQGEFIGNRLHLGDCLGNDGGRIVAEAG